MAIKDINARVDAMTQVEAESTLPQWAGEPSPTDDPLTEPQPTEFEPTASLVDVVVKKVISPIRVMGEAIGPARVPTGLVDTPEQKALIQQGERMQQEITSRSIAAEKTKTEGLVQKTKKALGIKGRPSGQAVPAREVTPEELQAIVEKTKKDLLEAGESAVQGEIVEGSNGAVIKTATKRQTQQFLDGLEDEPTGIDYNFNYLRTTEDIDRAIDSASKVFAKETDVAKRGILRDSALKDMAARLDIAPEILEARVGTIFPAEKLYAARHMLVNSATRLDELQKMIKGLPEGVENDKLYLNFASQLAVHGAISLRLKASITESARAVRSMRLPVDGTVGLSNVNQIASILNEFGGKANLKSLASAYGDLIDAEKQRFVELGGAAGDKFKGIWKELYYASQLTNVATVERVGFGALLSSLSRSGDTLFAGTVGKTVDKVFATPVFGSRTGDQVNASEAIIEIANFIYSIPSASKVAWRSFTSESAAYRSVNDIEKTPDAQITSKLFSDPNTPVAQSVDFIGKMIRLGQRGIAASDEGAKAMVAVMETRRQAARDAFTAIDNGMDADTALNGMAHQISNPDVRILERVDQAGIDTALQTDLGRLGNAIQSVRNNIDFKYAPIGTMLVPYIKSVINMEKQLLARTPLAIFTPGAWTELSAGGARRQMALGKMSYGTGVMAYFSTLAMDGTCTGAGPTNPEYRKFLQETTGWQPFSCKFGDKYYSYAGLEPIGGLIGVAATLAEVGSVYANTDNEAEFSDLVTYAALMPFKYVGELPFMQSMASFTKMIEDAKRDPTGEMAADSFSKFFGTIGQSFIGGVPVVPNPIASTLRQIENYIDPTKRDIRIDPSLSPEQRPFDFAWRTFLAKTPILSSEKDESGRDKIRPKRNIWGDVVESGQNDALHWVLPFNASEEKLDNVSKKVLEIAKARGKMPFSMPDRSIENIKINDNEYSDLIELMNLVQIDGRSMKAKIASILSDPDNAQDIKNNRNERVASLMSTAISDYKKEAYKSPVFIGMYPDLSQQIMRNEKMRELYIKQEKRLPVTQ